MSINEKMDDALGNHKYGIYMKNGAFAQPEDTPKYFILVNYNT